MRAHATFCRHPLHPGPCAKPKSWTAHHRRHREASPISGEQRHTVESAKGLSDDDVLRHTAEIKARRKGLDKNSEEHKNLLKQEHVLMREKYRRQREGTWGQNATPSAPAPAKKAVKAAPRPPAPPPASESAPAGTTPHPANAADVAAAQRDFDRRARVAARRRVDATLALAPSRALPDSQYTRGLSNVPESVQSAAHEYRVNGYVRMNDYLRDGVPVSSDVAQRISDLTDGINSSRLTDNAMIYRGMTDGRHTFGQNFDGDMTGLEYTDRGFVSTTADSNLVDIYTRGATSGGTSNVVRPTRMRILAPAGTPALQVSERQFGESELVLSPGSRFRVVRDNGTDANGVRQLDVEVVPNEGRSIPSTPTKAQPTKAVKKAQPAKRVATAPTPPPPPAPAKAAPAKVVPAKAGPRKAITPPRNNRFPNRQVTDISPRLTQLRVNPQTARDIQHVNEEFHAQYGISFTSVENTRVAMADRPNTIAYVRNGHTLGVNPKLIDNARMYQRDERTGWSAPGTASVQGTMIHEMGHYLVEFDGQYGLGTGRGQDVWADSMRAARSAPDFPSTGARFTSLREAVGSFSRYGQTDSHESEAELFAFYHLGGSQRPQWVIAWGQAYHRGHGFDPTPIGERL